MPYKDKGKQKEYLHMYYIKHKERLKETKANALKKWRASNKEHISKYNTTYSAKNKHKRNAREKLRRDSDSLYRMKINLRRRIRASIINKTGNTTDILGCSYDEVRHHLSSNFKNGMSWENYGEWHIDHIIPLATANTDQEACKLCHYSNLQPLWAEENLLKSTKT